ncbi:hypothetical protein KDA14_01125, partial [Candidatus Saccharibacteria bacterium]|nr:hypothetical protein [Candidatus Saccharibacteria bacterium]
MELFAIVIASLVGLALLGIVIAFSPTLILAEVAILTRGKDPVPRTIALVSGITTAVAVFSVVAFALIDPTKEITLPSTR